MSNYNNSKKILNWLVINDSEASINTEKGSIKPKIHENINFSSSDLLLHRNKTSDFNIVTQKRKGMIKNDKKNPIKRRLNSEVEETELIKSPVSGTYIIKEWNSSSTKKDGSRSKAFSKSEVDLNSIAASFVEITPQSRAKLERIPNKIGPYECKLCKVVYKDAFELAMHNCPRVVHIDYRCSECGKCFNCPANLASHKRWHRPNDSKIQKNSEIKTEKSRMKNYNPLEPSRLRENAPKEDVVYETKFENNSAIKLNATSRDTDAPNNYHQTISSLTNQQSIWNQFFFQPYPSQFASSLSNMQYNSHLLNIPPLLSSAATSFLLNKSDAFSKEYSNHFSAAAQSLLSSVNFQLPLSKIGNQLFNSNPKL